MGSGRFWPKKNMFWLIWAVKSGFCQFWLKSFFSYVDWKDRVLTKNKMGSGQWWPKKRISVDFDPKKQIWVDLGWKNWDFTPKKRFWLILAEKSGFRRFWLKNWDFDWNNMVFGQFWPRKRVFGQFWPKTLVRAHLGSLGLIWACLGSEIGFHFCDLNTGPRGIRTQNLNVTIRLSVRFRKLSPVRPIYYWGGWPLKPVNLPLRPPGGPTEKKLFPR